MEHFRQLCENLIVSKGLAATITEDKDHIKVEIPELKFNRTISDRSTKKEMWRVMYEILNENK